jgi:hypothetical protein
MEAIAVSYSVFVEPVFFAFVNWLLLFDCGKHLFSLTERIGLQKGFTLSTVYFPYCNSLYCNKLRLQH